MALNYLHTILQTQSPWQLALLLTAGAVLLRVLVEARRSKRSSCPPFPGPRGLPLLGNYHQLGDKQWLQYTEWHKVFGPIFSLNFVGTPVLVVGNAKMAADLMDRRGTIYSDRPRFIMATEILTGGMNLAFAPWGQRWKRMRKVANLGLSAKASAEYAALQENEARYFLRGLLTCEGKVDAHIRRTSASMILSAIYAYPPLPPPSSHSHLGGPHSLVAQIEDYVARMLKAALPGNYLVDFFPSLLKVPMWFPGASWKREGYAWFRKDTEMFQGLIQETVAALDNGTRGTCFVSKLLQNTSQHDLDPVETAWLAGMMAGAGTEALAATLSFFVLAMLLFPHVQDKLRAEIDSIVGRPDDFAKAPRLPTFNDTQKMPYLQAVIKEVMRWRPMGPLAVPHRSVQDDIYDGHFVPAGTLILPNVWAMHYDESVYPDATQFKPERFLAEDGVTPVAYPDTKDLGHHGFGFGRRMCSGYNVANNALAINAANIVWAFLILKAKGQSGREVTPDSDNLLDEGLAVRPMPFECVLQPRSTLVIKLISRTVDEL